jgi:alanine-synthesizing transaminase
LPFSRRVAVGNPNALTTLLDAKRRAGAVICDLTSSNPTRAGLPYPFAEILAALADPAALIHEPAPLGLEVARAAVAADHARRGLLVHPDDVALTASTSEAYAYLFKLLCDAGDEVLAPAPCYPLLDALASAEGVRLARHALAYDGEWHLDFAALEAAITPATRAILIVSPGNPTGAYLREHELARLATLGLPLIVDEVFAEYPTERAPRDRVALAARRELPTLVFSLGGLSKSVGLPQLKLAWIIAGGPADLRALALERLEHLADGYLSVGAPVMHAAGRLLVAGASVRAAIRARIALGRQALAATALEVLPAEGGWSALVRVPAIRTDEEWALALLRDHDVLVQPGYFFDFPRGAYLVLSLLASAADLARGAQAIAGLGA